MNEKQKKILTSLFEMAMENQKLRMKTRKFVQNSSNSEIKELYINTMLEHEEASLTRKRKK